MKALVIFVLAVALAAGASATRSAEPTPPELWQEDRTLVFDATDVALSDFRWIARPIVVFANSPADPRFLEQMKLLAARPEALATRDVVVITDTDPSANSSVRQALRPSGFMVVLIAKDGAINLRKPVPWDVRELTRSIDKMPLRQDELRR